MDWSAVSGALSRVRASVDAALVHFLFTRILLRVTNRFNGSLFLLPENNDMFTQSALGVKAKKWPKSLKNRTLVALTPPSALSLIHI